jgi:hypothetical protein
MRRARRLSLHHHLEEAASQSTRERRRRRPRGIASNKTSLVCHYCKRKGHNTVNYWYSEACSFCKKKGHLEASCWEKQATCHKPKCFSKEGMERRLPQSNNKLRGTWRKVCQAVHSNQKNFFHHCKLSGHWEAKCW